MYDSITRRLSFVPAQVEMLMNLHRGPHLVIVMEESNQPVQAGDYYTSNQQIPQVAAIYRDHNEKTSVRGPCCCG
jgi:hypothetical protein